MMHRPVLSVSGPCSTDNAHVEDSDYVGVTKWMRLSEVTPCRSHTILSDQGSYGHSQPPRRVSRGASIFLWLWNFVLGATCSYSEPYGTARVV